MVRSLLLRLLALMTCGPIAVASAADKPLVDAPPAWHDQDRADIALPETRDPNVNADALNDTFVGPVDRWTDPGTLVRRAGVPFGGDHVPAASNVNALDEVPNSSWFTNRIGLFPMTPEEAALGPGPGTGPDRSAPWTVVGAKTEGVTPGFTIRDGAGARFLIKFDPPGELGGSTGAGAISARIMYAAGYFVPDDVVVDFRREDLVIDPGAKITTELGKKRAMLPADIDEILAPLEKNPDGSWRAISSRFLTGKPVGPFDYHGRRHDDPNDRVEHQDRRELRGLRILAAWINHFDTKQGNTLDTWIEEDGRHYIRHQLIDFASTLGVGANGAEPRYSHEYTFDLPAIMTRLVTLGLREDPWRQVERPANLPEIGYFDTKGYSSFDFRPFQPNSAFAFMTDRDGYWAAKIVSAFDDDILRAIATTAKYRDPDATEYIWRALAVRRDAIAREWFARVPPIDFFTLVDGTLQWHDLGVERGVYAREATSYSVGIAAVDREREAAPVTGSWSGAVKSDTPSLALSGALVRALEDAADAQRYPFLALDVSVDRGQGEGPRHAVTCYVARASRRVIALDR